MNQHKWAGVARDPVRVLHDEIEQLPGKPAGIARAARLVGRSPGVLYNKFSEADERYALTVAEALSLGHCVAHELGTVGFAEAIAEQFGGVFVPLPEGVAGVDDVLQAHLDVIERLGELSHELTAARADGLIDVAEFARVKARALRGIAAIHALVSEVESMTLPSASVAGDGVVSLRRGA